MTLPCEDRCILGIFAKQPIAGQAKTRLAQATSSEWATQVAAAFLADTLGRMGAIQCARMIVYAPGHSTAFFTSEAAGRFELLPQAEGDLGQRLRSFFTHAQQLGFTRCIAIGTDSPTLPLEFVERGFRLLDNHDVVIGPAYDGGYYLVGTGGKEIDLFRDIAWSSAQVLAQTLRRVRGASARFALLPAWYDVDTLDDWAMLCRHVDAMRRAGIDPQVPRVEKLLDEPRPSGSVP